MSEINKLLKAYRENFQQYRKLVDIGVKLKLIEAGLSTEDKHEAASFYKAEDIERLNKFINRRTK